jgi:hypothetical protein
MHQEGVGIQEKERPLQEYGISCRAAAPAPLEIG